MKRAGRAWFVPTLALGALLLSSALPLPAATGGGLAAPSWVAVAYLSEQGRVALRWSPVPGADSYRLWRRRPAGAPPDVLATTVGIQHFDATLAPGQTALYSVQALRGAEEGPLSEERPAGVPAAAPAGVPAATSWLRTRIEHRPVRGGPAEFRVELKWLPIAEAAGYRLFRREAGAADFTELGLHTETTAYDAAVTEGRTYEYQITTLGPSLDESPPSMVRTVTVAAQYAAVHLPPLPPPPAFIAVRAWAVFNDPQPRAPQRAQLDDPYDVAYDAARDRLYVSVTTTGRIVVLRGEDGTLLETLGPTFGAARLERPLGLALDRSGNLLVADETQGALLVLSPNGEMRRRIVLAGKGLHHPPRPLDAAVHPDKRIFVADGANRQIVVLAADGKQLARWGAPKGAEPLLSVGAIEISPEGNVVVADAAATRVRVFTPAGRAVAAHGARGAGEGDLYFLGGLTTLVDGTILASDLWNSTLAAYGRTSGALALAAARPGEDAPPLLGPLNLANDGARRIFVVEAIANRVTCLRLLDAKQPAAGMRP